MGAPSVSMLPANFDPYRQYFLHAAGAATSAAIAALFFVISRMQFGTRVALVTSACLAFATMQWGFLSQSMMQHGPSSLVVMAAWYLLLLADRSSRRAGLLLFATGLL